MVAKYAEEKYRHLPKPVYYNPQSPERLPEGNNGLGLKLLGLSGDEVLAPDAYAQCKAKLPATGTRHGAGRYFERRSGTKHLHFQHRICLKLMGDVQEYFIRKGAELLLVLASAVPHCRSRRQPHLRSWPLRFPMVLPM
jgi:isobutyryl-CoA mutase